MIVFIPLRHLRDAYRNSPNAIHLCVFSPEFAAAWQAPTQREALCELARRFLHATDRESDWTTPDVPSTCYDILFRNVLIDTGSRIADHNIRVDFLNWLLEQPDNTTPPATTPQP